jgi:hypothetical protein
MGILIGFAPFFVFSVLTRFASPGTSLWAAAGTCAILILHENVRGSSIKILEAGTFVLFAVLGSYSFVARSTWDVPIVRTVVDSGLLATMLLSLIIRRPFTFQYTKEEVSESVWQSPTFLKNNQIISSAWVLAM